MILIDSPYQPGSTVAAFIFVLAANAVKEAYEDFVMKIFFSPDLVNTRF